MKVIHIFSRLEILTVKTPELFGLFIKILLEKDMTHRKRKNFGIPLNSKFNMMDFFNSIICSYNIWIENYEYIKKQNRIVRLKRAETSSHLMAMNNFCDQVRLKSITKSNSHFLTV